MHTRYLNHITLTTGHSRKSYRSEVGDHIILMLAPIVDALRSGKKTDLPVEGYWINCVNAGKSCVVWTIWHVDGSPVATLGLAARSRGGRAIWQALHDMESPDDVVTDRDEVPTAPWLAARLHIGTILHPDCMEWLGDFERCVAWAWLESKPESA